MMFGIFLPFEFQAGCFLNNSHQFLARETNYFTMGCLSQPIPLARSIMPKDSKSKGPVDLKTRRKGGSKPAAVAAAKAKAKAAAKGKAKTKPVDKPQEDGDDRPNKKRK